ncbi:MAG: hypothetical protein V3V00_06445 [Saprospiraceae bacterium]
MKNCDDLIRNIFSGIDDDHSSNLEIEEKVIMRIREKKDHSVIIRKYKRFAQVGNLISILLFIIISFWSIVPLFNLNSLQPNSEILLYIPTMYASLALLILFFQSELKREMRGTNK